MKQLFTIGSSKKTAEKFFALLIDNDVKCVIDVRLYNTYQLAGFSKYPDIKYFLKKIANIEYISDSMFAPSADLLSAYREKKISWEDYIERFTQIMEMRGIIDYIGTKYEDLDGYCLLCSENKPDKCHRRLLADMICEHFGEYDLKHLI